MLLVIIFAALSGVLSVASSQKANIACSEPPDVNFAFVSNVTDENYVPGTTVTYSCESGYSLSGGGRSIYCNTDDSGEVAKWSETRFVCAPKSCGDPGYLNNGRRVGFQFTFPNFVKYECDDGYKIKGLPTRYCQTSGVWSGKLPSCNIVTCNQPEEIPNGRVTYNSLEYGSELSHICNEGFKLQMDGKAYCTADGQWSKNNAECVESPCDIPVAPDHGTVRLSDNEQKPRSGTIALYECEGDRIAYGATTSKCLENGQWLFPAPECLSPCSVPDIHNGNIGRYQRRKHYGAYSFYVISAGTKIEEGDEMVLRCSKGYEVGGTQNKETEISCSRGKWSLKPHCEPASCRLNPPRLQNAEILETNREHGGRVIYRCLKNFKKIKDENVICEFGAWKPPYLSNICQSARCSKDKLNFSGLKKGYWTQSTYEDDDLFQIKCEAGYKINDEAELRCSEGDWKTNVPPCVPVNCAEPPAIPFTNVEMTSTSHDSYATYACQEPYKLIGNPRVRCRYGEWKNLPRCDDGRCDINDLTHSSHISHEETPRYFNSGQKLRVTCKTGYSPRIQIPNCLNGVWKENYKSPCKENDCLVPKVEHGYIVEKVYGNWYWDFWGARYVQEVNDKTVPFGTLCSPATAYQLLCHSGYSFQGSSETERTITCTEGKWHPEPACIPPGSILKSTISSSLNKETTSILEETTPVSVNTQSKMPPDPDVTQPEVVTTELPTTAEPVECSCQYPVKDENLVATVDGTQLHFLDKVKNGSVVVFRCLRIGFHRFRGHREMKCENCQNWHSSDFPTCSEPSVGDAVIVFERNYTISLDGSLEVKKGQELKLGCIAFKDSTYPNWTIPSTKGVAFSWETKVPIDHEDVLYISLLKIGKADLEYDGVYHCIIEDHAEKTSTVSVTVFDPNMQCPEFEEDDGIVVSFDNERRVKSTASFTCKYQAKELKGKEVVVCLTNGNWSDPPPQCLQRKCKMLEETGQLKIYYPNDRKIGSLATFHCLIGANRTGVASAECMENGLWSDPAPSCDYPPCELEDLYSSLPQRAVPEKHNVRNSTLPYNTEIALTCEGFLIALGDRVAKCEKNGTWKMPSFRCGSGCPAVEKAPDSKLKVEPKKGVYNFGEMVQFSCPPGMNLTSNLQQIVCMQNGWSETSFPDCKEKKNITGI